MTREQVIFLFFLIFRHHFSPFSDIFKSYFGCGFSANADLDGQRIIP